jgi:signal peptidase I
VADGHFFVLGDNRPRSSDSREFGQVPQGLLKGKVDVRLWPPARLGLLE